eukprot:gene29157-32379_t
MAMLAPNHEFGVLTAREPSGIHSQGAWLGWLRIRIRFHNRSTTLMHPSRPPEHPELQTAKPVLIIFSRILSNLQRRARARARTDSNRTQGDRSQATLDRSPLPR